MNPPDDLIPLCNSADLQDGIIGRLLPHDRLLQLNLLNLAALA